MKIKKHIKNIRFDLIDADPAMEHYRQGGEYQALRWLRGYVEHRTGEPRQLFKSLLNTIATGRSLDPVNDALFAQTIFSYI